MHSVRTGMYMCMHVGTDWNAAAGGRSCRVPHLLPSEPPAPRGMQCGMTAPLWVVCMCVSFPWRSKLIWPQEHGICPRHWSGWDVTVQGQSVPLPLVLAFDLFTSCGAASLFQCFWNIFEKVIKGLPVLCGCLCPSPCDYVLSFCLQANVLALLNLFHKLAALSHLRGGSCTALICMFPGGSVIRTTGER